MKNRPVEILVYGGVLTEVYTLPLCSTRSAQSGVSSSLESESEVESERRLVVAVGAMWRAWGVAGWAELGLAARGGATEVFEGVPQAGGGGGAPPLGAAWAGAGGWTGRPKLSHVSHLKCGSGSLSQGGWV